MKNHRDMLITVASWEDRFTLGFERIIKQFCPKVILMYFFKEYAEISHQNRIFIEEHCKHNNIEIIIVELSFEDSVTSWRILFDTIINGDFINKNIIVDISTMPREIIWTIFDLLEEKGANISYLYNKPKGYNDEWLSRDPGRPRLVFKLAGEARLGKPTLLLILTGFDPDRTDQLIHFFEPRKCFIGLQIGESFSNQKKNIEKHEARFGKNPLIELFDIDAYSIDHGLVTIDNILKPYLINYNILMSSLGPKLSAVALYKIHKMYPQTALVYAPSGQFNRNYSHGIGGFIHGKLT